MLKELKAANKQVLNLEPSLVELCLTNLHLLALGIHRRLLLLNKVGHEKPVRYQLKPGKGKTRVSIRVDLLEQIGHIKEYLSLGLLVETVTHVEDGQDVDQHSVIRLLIEGSLL